MNSEERFQETRLPARQDFHNYLTQQDISDEDWEQVNKLWTQLGFINLRQYASLYVVLDVTLLGDCMEEFRRLGLCYYGLEPLNYLSLPGYAFSSALKMSHVEIQLLSGDLYIWWELFLKVK